MPSDDPWYADVRDRFEASENPIEREVLADGNITDQELSQIEDQRAKCFSDLGISYALDDAADIAGGFSGDELAAMGGVDVPITPEIEKCQTDPKGVLDPQ